MSRKLILFKTATILFLMNFLSLDYAFSMDKFYLRVPIQEGGGIAEKFSTAEEEYIRQFKKIISGIGEYFKENLLRYIQSLRVSIEIKYLLMAHTFGNDLQIAITRSSLIIQALEKHTLTPTDCLGYIEKSVDPVNRLVAMLEVFTTEENLFSYAKILSASNIKERQELATLINTNADFRKQFANIAMQCYSYVKRQRDNLQEIEVYFKKRDINSQIRHLVPAEDL